MSHNSLQDAIASDLETDQILERFLDWVKSENLELYAAQEEAILELISGGHLILNTPTGSGKSLVALAMHFKALCQKERSFYTAPIKALVSEKFFSLCETFGAERVGMLTGDAAINAKAPIVCCTAEVLANMALRKGRQLDVDYVIMDEFHYYADRSRGMAWQLPLITLPDANFLLMSATLGDVRSFVEHLQKATGRETSVVKSQERPVPLDFSYVEKPLHQTVQALAEAGKAPIYLVNFSQREAAEQAQNLSSADICPKEEKKAIVQALRGFRFDSPYGKDVRRLVQMGIGMHHAGLLPKYRLLIEQLAKQGLLKLISGTDTLGVGVNVPIRTVVFTKLSKFDGQQSGLLSVRDFQQIAGRAGRKGYDDQGYVVCQAPEHVIENKQLMAKAAAKGGKKKPKKRSPPKGYVPYDAATFEKLYASEPESLRSVFTISHGLMLNVLNREMSHGQRDGGYRKLMEIIERSHENLSARHQHRRQAAVLFRALRKAGIIEVARPSWSEKKHVCVQRDLQQDFSLHQSLSLYLVDTLFLLDPKLESYALDVLTLVEAIVENPQVILYRQEDIAKRNRIMELKAQGVDYEQRIEELEKVSYPKPHADFLYDTFDRFRETRPWVRHDNVRPKSIARDMVERYASFNEYVVEYGLQRSEGVLLRYLSNVYKTLIQTVPENYRDERVEEVAAYLRTVLEHADSSLVREWESMLEGEEFPAETLPEPKRRLDPTRDKKRFYARVRAEAHRLLKALAGQDYEEATLGIWQPEADSDHEEAWGATRLQETMAPYFETHESLIFDHRARLSEHSQITPTGRRVWEVRQTLLDPADERLWYFTATVDLSEPEHEEQPWLRLTRLGSS